MLQTSEAKNSLERFLQEAGVTENDIDLERCLAAFERFSHERVHSDEDALLWEAGTFQTAEGMCSLTQELLHDPKDAPKEKSGLMGMLQAICTIQKSEKMYTCSMTRQFRFGEGASYDHTEQLCLAVYYAPCRRLKRLHKTLWSYDFDDDFARFFAAVRSERSFCVPAKEAKPVRFEVTFSRV